MSALLPGEETARFATKLVRDTGGTLLPCPALGMPTKEATIEPNV